MSGRVRSRNEFRTLRGKATRQVITLPDDEYTERAKVQYTQGLSARATLTSHVRVMRAGWVSMSEEQRKAVTAAGATEREPFGELEQAVHSDPASGSAWASLGCAYQDAGAHELAGTAFEQAVRFCPGSPMHWFGLGIAGLDTGDLQGALAAARRAVELAPALAGLRLLLARAYGRLGFYRQSILHLEEAIRIDPEWPIAQGDLGFAQIALGDFGAAGEAFEASLRLDPDQPALWSPLGKCLLEQRGARARDAGRGERRKETV